LHVSNKKQELLAFTGTWVPGFPVLIAGIHVLLFCVVVCVLFVFVMCPVHNFVLCLVHLTIPVSLDCPFLIDPSVFSNVYLYVSLDCSLLIFTSVFLAINQ
jgi:hypothetical protein